MNKERKNCSKGLYEIYVSEKTVKFSKKGKNEINRNNDNNELSNSKELSFINKDEINNDNLSFLDKKVMILFGI